MDIIYFGGSAAAGITGWATTVYVPPLLLVAHFYALTALSQRSTVTRKLPSPLPTPVT